MNTPAPTKEKLTTIGQGGKRFWLYPAKFTGVWVNRRRNLAYLLILLFFITPWIKIGGEQAVLMDLNDRKFAFFGLVFWPQDTVIFWFVMVGLVIAIFLITALWGRLWCGWACPQTVFLEHFFRRIEIWIEGDAAQRRRLDQGPWTVDKVRKKSLKYFIFLLFSSHFANTVLCYFVGTGDVISMTFHNPGDNWGWFTFMAFFNLLFFLDFAWFREQFCLIACPYGRFQSVLLDDHSTIVGYDYNRGEPRGVLRKNQERQIGDCIDCNRCVAVCPTGIDIRMGLQMECINCTACMDACDAIMDKVKKPRGLIRYTSNAELEGTVRKYARPRVFAYALLLLFLWSTATWLVINKDPLILRVIRPPGQSFTLDESQTITNHFQVKASNKTDEPWSLTITAPEGYSLITPINPWPVSPQQNAETPIFISRKSASFSDSGKERIPLTFHHNGEAVHQAFVTILGPAQ